MAVRSTESAVKALLGLDYDVVRKPSLTVHVASASAVVDDLVTFATDEGITFTSTRQELVERWLACWFYTAVDPLYSQRSTLGVSGGFLRGKDEYKERASALDPTGALDALLMNNVATMSWAGKSPLEQTDYEDRR